MILKDRTGIIIIFLLFLLVSAGFFFNPSRDKEENLSREVLEETTASDKSRDAFWWLNSGGIFYAGRGGGETIQGELPAFSKWRIRYYLSNPEDTDSGKGPQNIFRLITKGHWRNLREEGYFLVTRPNNLNTSNRNASNGLLLLFRYQDEDNSYYAGLRVDGAAVIKKKKDGIYHTLAYEPVLTGNYERTSSPNLLPTGIWMGLKTEVRTLENNEVEIKLFSDIGRTGVWQLLLEVKDSGVGGAPILESGAGGIRTDFMDVQFSDFKIEEI